jgi:hypothetical protein
MIDRANATYRSYGKTWTQYATTTTDALTTTPTTVPWGPALQDGTGWISGSNWPTSFSSTKYAEFTFPSNTPGAAVISSVSFENRYRSSLAGSDACYYIEVYSDGSLIGTHGSTSSPVSCNSTTTYATDTISLPEVDTAAEANGLTIRLYGKSSGSRKTEHDLVRLGVTYSLGDTGCTDPGTTTITSTKDSWADQNAPTSTSGGTSTTMKVKSQNGSRNRRAFVYFPLPSLGDGCSVQSATLRLYQTNAAGTRTIEASRATASWTEAALSWNTQPGSAGTPVGVVANTASTWVTWNATTLVSALISSGNYGFVIKDSAEDGATANEQQFSTREGANPPQLVLTTG